MLHWSPPKHKSIGSGGYVSFWILSSHANNYILQLTRNFQLTPVCCLEMGIIFPHLSFSVFAVLRYQCCKQRSPGRDSRNPLLFPSPKKRWPPDHPEAVCAPVSYENNLCLSSAPRHLRYVVFKDIQGCEIALGVGRQDHGELKYILMQIGNYERRTIRQVNQIKESKQWHGQKDLRKWDRGKRLFDPRPRYVLLPFFRHPPGEHICHDNSRAWMTTMQWLHEDDHLVRIVGLWGIYE